MAESGGPTTQSGIYYQNAITTLYLGRLLDLTQRPADETVITVRPEAPSEVDDTVVTFEDNHKIFIQAKERITRTSSMEWRKLWKDFYRQFQNKEFNPKQDRLQLYLGHERFDLKGLCDRTKPNISIQDWEKGLTKTQKTLRSNIESIIAPNGLSPQSMMDFLSTIDVESISKEAIIRDRLRDWMPHTNRNQKELFYLLYSYVGQYGSNRQELTADFLRARLHKDICGLEFDTPANIVSLREEIKLCNSSLLKSPSEFGKTGIYIEHDVVNVIVDWLLSDLPDEKNVSVLLDQAGMGKTVLMKRVLLTLQEKNIDVLAIKADRQLSSEKSRIRIQERLGLTFTVEKSIETLAKFGRVVVLVDQIDALSLSLAHDQQTLDIVLDLIARISIIPNVSILLSCRRFDYNSDPRLNGIMVAKQFEIPALQPYQIQQVLDVFGLKYNQLANTAQLLLQTPLHLNLFVLILSEGVTVSQLHDISSLQKLYALIWDAVICKHTQDAPPREERIGAIDYITTYMDTHQKTSMPIDEISGFESAQNWLASEGILINDTKDGWSFLHQTFFDYCYARKFVKSGNKLANVIITSRQGIFDRSKLVQILAYLRGYDHHYPVYLENLRQLFNSDQLRFHMRDLLFRWFGSILNPNEDEWLIALPLLQDRTTFSSMLSAMQGNTGWFDYIQPLLDKWLRNQSTRHSALRYLHDFSETKQAEVITTLTPFLNDSDEWNAPIADILLRIGDWHTDEAVILYEKIIFSHAAFSFNLWLHLDNVSRFAPVVACRLIYRLFSESFNNYIEKRSKKSENINDMDESLFSSLLDDLREIASDLEQTFNILSEQAPEEFIRHILPWVEQVLSYPYFFTDNMNSFPPDYFSTDWFDDDSEEDSDSGLKSVPFAVKFIHAFLSAFNQLAQNDPDKLRHFVSRLENFSYDTPNRIICIVYASQPSVFYDDAFRFLISDKRRLDLGDNEQEDSRKLISSIYPYLTDEQQTQLEQQIMNYAPIAKWAGTKGLYFRGIQQYRLLFSIPSQYLSAEGQKRLQEWQRKFPHHIPDTTVYHTGYKLISSPIDENIAEKMSNQNWLDVMSKYSTSFDQTRNLLKSYADEIANVLTQCVRSEPSRFYELFQHIPSTANHHYIWAFVNGFVNAGSPVEWIFEAFRRYAKDASGKLQKDLSKAVMQYSSHEIPEDIVTQLMVWSHKDMNEDEEEWINHPDPYQSYLHTERGSALSTLMRIYDTDIGQEQKWKLIEYIATEPSTIIRIGAVHELKYMIRCNPSRSWQLFEKMIDGHEIIRHTKCVATFLKYSMYHNFSNVQPYIEDMMGSSKEAVQEQGAKLACLASLLTENFSEAEQCHAKRLGDLAIRGTPIHREAAAYVYGGNIVHSPDSDTQFYCKLKLKELSADRNRDVRGQINMIFYNADGTHFYSLKDLAVAIADQDDYPLEYKFAEYLWEYGKLDPEWTLLLIQTMLLKDEPIADWGLGIDKLMRFTLQICTSHVVDDSLLDMAMATFDLLMERYSGAGNSVLIEWDRR
ncbi:MAG: ATP-binding protein [Chloroflexota bacterium]